MPKDPLAKATSLSCEGDELYEEGRWHRAAQKFELACDAYVGAALLTTDSGTVQAIRQLALSHAQRAHEIRLRIKIHNMQPEAGDAEAQAAAAPPSGGADPSGAAGAAQAESPAASAALGRLSSQLISTLEALQFGAEELARLELLVPSDARSSMGASLMGGGSGSAAMGGSFCIVPSGSRGTSASQRYAFGDSAVHARSPLSSPVVGRPPGPSGLSAGLSGGGPSQLAPHAEAGPGAASAADSDARKLSQLAAENRRLTRENQALRQRATEAHSVFVKAQRRAADQQRLARKALNALREVHAMPRPELPADTAKEIANLRGQLEAAHAARQQQAELVRKYEQRWAQLKASARRKQQSQAANAQEAANASAATPQRPQSSS